MLGFFYPWKTAHSGDDGAINSPDRRAVIKRSRPEGQGKDLYLTKCTKCHKLYDPTTYEDDPWASWMRKMKKKAHLSDEQYELISGYLESLRKNNGVKVS